MWNGNASCDSCAREKSKPRREGMFDTRHMQTDQLMDQARKWDSPKLASSVVTDAYESRWPEVVFVHVHLAQRVAVDLVRGGITCGYSLTCGGKFHFHIVRMCMHAQA